MEKSIEKTDGFFFELDKQLNIFKEMLNNPERLKEMAKDIAPTPEDVDIVSDLFNASIQSLFKIGFELAKDLNLELLLDQSRFRKNGI